jgi:hypothetical protein
MKVWSKERGLRALKPGASFEAYKAKYPSAIKANRPSEATLAKWDDRGGCKAVDGCWVEPDGHCGHGMPSWMLAMGVI